MHVCRLLLRKYLIRISLAALISCPVVGAGAGVLPRDAAEPYELTFWTSIRDSPRTGDYRAYLQAYPKGRFAPLARLRAKRLATPLAPTASAAATPAPPHAVSEITDCPICPTLVMLRPGSFTMGSNGDDPTERPAFHVAIGASFAIGKYEVTTGQWHACVAAGGCPEPETGASRPPDTPARNVSWDDARAYVAWLRALTGRKWRLPTEAEWEYAARGGTTTRYPWGDRMTAGKASCTDCGERRTADGPSPAGFSAPNPFGLYDMNGGVREWVSDCWHDSYRRAPSAGRSWEEPDCGIRVLRGGSWHDGARDLSSSTRFRQDAGVRQPQNGLRVVRDAQ